MKAHRYCFSLILMGGLSARAQDTCTWTGAANDGNWNTSMNWECSPSGSKHPPLSGDAAIVATVFFAVIEVPGSVTVQSLFLSGPRLLLRNADGTRNSDLTVLQNLTWSGGALIGTVPGSPVSTVTVGGTATLNGVDKTLSGNVTLELTGGASWDAGRFLFEANATLRNAAGSTFELAHPGDITMITLQGSTTLIENHGTMVKTGASAGTTAFIRFENTGTLSVEAGTLALNGGSTHSTGTTVVIGSGATLALQSTPHTFDGCSISGAGTFHVNNATVDFTNGSTLTSAFLLDVGTFNADTPGFAASSYTHDGVTSVFLGTADATVNGPMTWAGGVIGGAGTFTVNGPALLTGGALKTLSGRTLHFTSGATWNDGNLALGSGGTMVNPAGQTFEIAHAGSRSVTNALENRFENRGALRKSAASPGTTSFGATLDNTGSVLVEAGTLNLLAGGTHAGGTVTVGSGTVLGFSSGTFTLDGSSIGGEGTVRFTSGSVQFENGSALTTAFEFTGGTFTANTVGFAPTSYAQTGFGAHFGGTADAAVNGPMTWSGGSIFGSGTFTVAGTALLTGSNQKTLIGRALVFDGGATWDEGPLSLSSGGTLVNPAGRTFEVAHPGDQSMAAAGTAHFDNAGTFRKTQPGTTTLAPAFDNTGTVQGIGTLAFTGAVDHQGTFAPGLSPGILTVDDDYENARLAVELGGRTPGAGHDRLDVDGSVVLGGVLDVDLVGGFMPQVGDTFMVLTCGGPTPCRSGVFDAVNAPVGVTFDVRYRPDHVTLEVTTALPVELASFDARLDGGTVLLIWTTASETNNAGFDIEWTTRAHNSTDAKGGSREEWTKVAFVEGHGTTSEPQSYTFRIDGLMPGRHQFRLGQRDYDGTLEFSPVVEVKLAVPGTHVLSAVYPNPFNTQAYFTLVVREAQHVTVSVYDALGRRVTHLFQGSVEAERAYRFELDGAGWASGLFFVETVGAHFRTIRMVTLVK